MALGVLVKRDLGIIYISEMQIVISTNKDTQTLMVI